MVASGKKRKYQPLCGKNDDSYDAFGALDDAVYEYVPEDTLRYDRYRDWLVSVLFLNTTQPFYFCACMESISGTYRYGKNNIPNARMGCVSLL